ncbi:LysR family transcriptional regulator [Aliamphritea ceti]|uniref:LysR family transcriptional regulator n=1 Tax=Aliamphritea ceti TaxID=1524258 RepID=UPI0021C4830A|nr:LysR family transcriptional regulator [Aliamphritea ceti]
MNWQAISYDWNQVRAFLATAEEGSLSAAARALQLTQPTLSRQVSELEQTLGVILFERSNRAMKLTETGLVLLEHVRKMADAANQISLTATGKSQLVEGLVSITTTNMFATYHLPPILARLREVAPNIEIEVIASNEVRDLRRREADIAIRHARPKQNDLIARKIGTTTANLYASRKYLATIGDPQDPAVLSKAEFIGFDQVDKLIEYLSLQGITVDRDQFKISTASGTAILAFIEQGLGISIISREIAALNPDLQLVLPQLPAIEIPFWLVTHSELRTSRKIQLVYAEIASYFETKWREHQL